MIDKRSIPIGVFVLVLNLVGNGIAACIGHKENALLGFALVWLILVIAGGIASVAAFITWKLIR